MYFVTCISFFAVILTYLSQYKNFNLLFKIAFIVITIIACIHYNFGTDYENYYNLFRELARYSPQDVLQLEVLFTEPGWALINILFSKLGDPEGFFVLVIVLNIIQNFVYYLFIKKHVPPKYRWLALTIYLFSSEFYILNFSMMRQGLAISLIVLACMYLSNKKYLFAFFIILLSSSIHKTSLIFLLAIPFFCEFRSYKILITLLWGLVIIAFASSSMVSSILSSVIGLQLFEKYQVYDDFGTTSIGIGFFISLIPYLTITFIVFREKIILSKTIMQMSLIMFLSLILNAFTLEITLIGRLMYFFTVFSIAVIPNVYSQVKPQPLRICILLIFLFMTFGGYSNYFKPSNWAYEGYRTFQTIFSAS